MYAPRCCVTDLAQHRSVDAAYGSPMAFTMTCLELCHVASVVGAERRLLDVEKFTFRTDDKGIPEVKQIIHLTGLRACAVCYVLLPFATLLREIGNWHTNIVPVMLLF